MSERDTQDRRDYEALSAWYDGEGPAMTTTPPGGPEAAERLAAYRAMTSALAAMPKPDVHPAFRTRVMAALREEAARPARPAFSWRWAGVAAGVLLVAAAVWPLMPGNESPAAPAAPVAENAAPSATESLYLRAVELPEAAFASVAPEPGVQNVITALDEETTAEMAAMGAAVEAMGAVAQSREDVGELLNTLDTEQEEQLKRMLLASVAEDWSI